MFAYLLYIRLIIYTVIAHRELNRRDKICIVHLKFCMCQKFLCLILFSKNAYLEISNFMERCFIVIFSIIGELFHALQSRLYVHDDRLMSSYMVCLIYGN